MVSRSIQSGRDGKNLQNECSWLFITLLLLTSAVFLALPVSAQGETVELIVSSDGSIPFRLGDIKPGFRGDGYSDVTNNGTLDCTLFVWIDNITGSYDLGKYLYFSVSSPRLSTNVHLPATIYEFPERPDAPQFIAVTPVRPGETVRLYWTWEFRETYAPQNEAQGKTLGFNILYTFQCPPPCLLPVADFEATPTSGIAPVTVQFTDRSTGEPTSWLWNFGDGTTSNLRNPAHTYQNPGSYTVSLTVWNACGPSDPEVKLNFISVSAIPPTTPPTTKPTTKPTTIPTTCPTICPTTKPTTIPTTCPTICPTTKPTTKPTTCPTTCPTICPTTKPTTIPTTCPTTCPTICPVPVAGFTANTTQGKAPAAIRFSDQSTGNPTAWLWNFGDGTTSVLQHPVHTYHVPGAYTVTLTVSSACGSSTEQKKNYLCIQPGPPVADFRANTTSGGAPLAVKFTDLSVGYPATWFWDFGDGSTSTEQNPVHTYQSPGAYTVTLTVSSYLGSDTEQKVSYIIVTGCEPLPHADFSANTTQGTAPAAIRFSDLSTGTPTAWFWDFGDGTTSILQHPVHTYQTPGVYTVSLTVFNPCGCDQERKVQYITVQPGIPVSPPVADFVANTTVGTVPLTVQFSDRSAGNPDSWLWDFGDGSTSTDQNPAHTYRVPGAYTVTLTVSNEHGTDTERKENYLCVRPLPPGSPPVAAFQVNVTTGTAPLTVQFSDHSSGDPFSWLWDFGDGTTATDRNPVHTYPLPGTYSVMLTVTNSHGSDTVWELQYIRVTEPAPPTTPPVADFSANRTSGVYPLTVQFSDLSTGNPAAWHWDFGDTTTSPEKDPVHSYSAPGTYTVTLTVTNAQGTDTKTRLAFITVTEPPPLVVAFTGYPVIGYGPLLVQFTDLSSDEPTEWLWSFGDGKTSTEQNPSHRYNPGIYTVTLTASNTKGSVTSSKTGYITVYSSGGASGGGGGGGGGGGFIIPVTQPTLPAPSPTPSETGEQAVTCDLPVDPDNRASEPFTLISPDGRAALSVDTGTRLTCNDHSVECIFLINIPPAYLPPVPDTTGHRYTGYSYAVRPECLRMDRDANLAITLTPEDWQLLEVAELSLWWWDAAEAEWRKLPSSTDRDARRVSTGVMNGGTYALFRDAGTTVPDIPPPVLPRGDHRIPMILALILLTGSLALHFGGQGRRTLSDGALVLWAAGTVILILGVLYQAFFITGVAGPHGATVHAVIGIFALVMTVAGLAAWIKIRDEEGTAPAGYLAVLLIISLVLNYLAVLLAFWTG